MSLTIVLVIITALISYAATNDYSMFNKLKHIPYRVVNDKEYYRLLTSGFVHSNRSWTHLLVNMFVLWQFGEIVEMYFVSVFGEMTGRLNFLLVYLLTIIAANMVTTLMNKDNPNYSAVGASGGVAGVLFAYLIFEPWSKIGIMLVIPCYTIIAAFLYLAYSHYASKNANDNIGHVAHFYGAVFGFLFTILLKPELFNVFVNNLINDFPF